MTRTNHCFAFLDPPPATTSSCLSHFILISSCPEARAIEPAQATSKGRRPPAAAGGEHGVPPPLTPSPSAPAPLFKQKSWSPDADRDEAWRRRKGSHSLRGRQSKSVTDEDMADLKASIELGFGFGFDSDSPVMDPRLSDTLPALGLYYAVNKQYYDAVSKSSSSSSLISSTASDCDSPSSSSCSTIFSPGDDPQTVKTRLRQWAQVVACSVRQSYG
ncbi:hypothetical protein NMG60_11026058 [Bertholletia excelsa]